MANVSSSNGLEKCPKLRFPGFDEPWVVRKLSDILSQRIEKQVPSEDAPLMAFTAEGGVEPKGERYDRSYLVKSEDKLYKRTEYNDFIYSSNNLDVGSIGLNKYGTAVISDVYEIFSVKSDCLPTFVSELIQRPQNLAKILKYRQGCLYGQYRIYAEDFLSVSVFVPAKQEQNEIAQFLDSIDKRIAHQHSLIEALKKYKRGLLSNLFGEKITQGCTTKSYYFSEIAQRRSEKYDPSSGIEYPCVELENIEQETGKILATVPSTAQSSIKNIAMSSDTLFGKLRPYLRKYAFAKKTVACSSEIWALIPSDVVLPKFLFYLVQTEQFLRVANISSGTKMPRAEWSNIEKAEFFIPDFSIQRKVVSLLEGLDRKITFEDSALFSLNRLKASLIQQLFI